MEQTGTTSRAVINLFLSIQRRFQRCDWLHPIYAQLTHSSISSQLFFEGEDKDEMEETSGRTD